MQRVVVLGASDDPERYSNRAVRMLLENGHQVIPVHPRLRAVEGLTVVPELAAVDQPVDTISVYLRPELSAAMADEIIRLKPGRVIMNPGTESDVLAEKLKAAGIPHEFACTLVLLRTGQF